jgi:hypothetical protein
MTIYSLVNTEDFTVELFKDLGELLVSMEFKIEPGAEVEIAEFNTSGFIKYKRKSLEILLMTVEAIDVYEDDILNFVIRRHEL